MPEPVRFLEPLPGAPALANIRSRPPLVDTGIRLRRGACYDLTADGTWDDWTIRCGPEGYTTRNFPHRLLARFKRVPDAPWFALIGVLVAEGSAPYEFHIGKHLSAFEPPFDAVLHAFANDLALMYWNNSGAVTLRVERLP